MVHWKRHIYYIHIYSYVIIKYIKEKVQLAISSHSMGSQPPTGVHLTFPQMAFCTKNKHPMATSPVSQKWLLTAGYTVIAIVISIHSNQAM